MHNLFFAVIVMLLAFPGTVFAASGPAGSVETLSASVISTNVTADVRASVQANLPQTQLYFEYGPTQDFGRQSSTASLRVGETKIVKMRLHALTPNVTYYYRAVIEGTAGTVYGETRTFVTNQNDLAYAQGGTISGNTNGGSGTQTNTDGSTSGGSGSTNGGALTGAVGNSLSGTGNSSGAGAQSGNQSGTTQNPGGFFQRLFDSVTRARPIQLSVAMNPEKPKSREIVEYLVTYTNGSEAPIAPGTLTITLPDSVVYLADNSGGRTTLSKVAGGQQLTLPTEALKGKEKRTMTVMAVAGSAVTSASPVAVASMGYTNAQGSVQNITTNKAVKTTALIAAPAASTNASPVASSDEGGILPNTFFEWLMFLAVVTGIIVIVRKVMATYQERKKRILEESREGTPAHA